MTLVEQRPRTGSTGTRGSAITGGMIAWVLLVLACWGTLLAVAAPVSTDVPVLRSTSPGAGATARPDDLLLSFDRPVPAGLAVVRMTDPYDREFDPGRPTHPDGRADTISVPIPKQKYAGTYHVAWRVPTNQLGSVGGTFTFDLASRSPVPAAPRLDAGPSTVATIGFAVAQFGALAALALLVGTVAFVAMVWPRAVDSTAARRLVGYSWVGLFVATLAVAVTYGPYAANAPLTETFHLGLMVGTLQSEMGATLLARFAVLALAGIGLAQFMSSAPAQTVRSRLLGGGSVLGCAAALATTWSFASHSVVGPLVPLSVVVDAIHLTAAAVLAGGLVMFGAVLRRKDVVADLPAIGTRFARTALVCASVLVATGAYQIWQQVGGFTALGTPADWLWVAKIALVLVLAWTGLVGYWRLGQHLYEPESVGAAEKRRAKRGLPAGVPSRLRGLVLAQAGIAAAVVAATTTLGVGQPSRIARAEPAADRQQAPPARLAFDTGGRDGQGSLDLIVVPAAGERALHVSAFDLAGEVKDDLTITAVFNPPTRSDKPVPVPLRKVAAGYSAGSVRLPSSGQWELALTARSIDGKQQTFYGVVGVA
ncbi:copper resistance protein CopC/CopD [Saccharopolyspora sp. K220]|uniref:copper resistance CopC/CopD family protein n=1 Tax=Saccharopolyspora soli TaxID=2926618 RepID=UPI001F5AF51E|nr:CopD family protein [Saccharopolyspora soli]MCI2415850.1 copper resistance protein CopC/CopD [Saccharopolyspora soli]